MKYRVKPESRFYDRETRITYREGSIIDLPVNIGDVLTSVLERLVPVNVQKIIPFIPAEVNKPTLPLKLITREDVLPPETEIKILEEKEENGNRAKLIKEFEAITLVREMRAFAKKHGISLTRKKKKGAIKKHILSKISR